MKLSISHHHSKRRNFEMFCQVFKKISSHPKMSHQVIPILPSFQPTPQARENHQVIQSYGDNKKILEGNLRFQTKPNRPGELSTSFLRNGVQRLSPNVTVANQFTVKLRICPQTSSSSGPNLANRRIRLVRQHPHEEPIIFKISEAAPNFIRSNK